MNRGFQKHNKLLGYIHDCYRRRDSAEFCKLPIRMTLTDIYVLILQSKFNVERNNPLYLASWDILAIIEEISITFDISKYISVCKILIRTPLPVREALELGLIRKGFSVKIQYILKFLIQGGSNMTGTDLCVNKPHCATAVRPWESEATTSTLPPARVRTCSVLSGSC